MRLEILENKAIELIRKSEHIALRYQSFGFVVAFSGGKDSQVLLDLVKRSGVLHRAIYNLTTLDPPENVHFIKETYPNVIIRRPKLSFLRLCEKHGILPSRMIRFCCAELKESSDAHSVVLTGVRHSESARRKLRSELEIISRRKNPIFSKGTFDQFSRIEQVNVECLHGKDRMVINPIIEWTEKDVWQYIEKYSLPINPLYTLGYRRVGCLFCPMANYKTIMKDVQRYPKYYAAFLRLIAKLRIQQAEKYDTQHWANLTDEEVFDCWARKMAIRKYQANKKQLSLNF